MFSFVALRGNHDVQNTRSSGGLVAVVGTKNGQALSPEMYIAMYNVPLGVHMIVTDVDIILVSLTEMWTCIELV